MPIKVCFLLLSYEKLSCTLKTLTLTNSVKDVQKQWRSLLCIFNKEKWARRKMPFRIKSVRWTCWFCKEADCERAKNAQRHRYDYYEHILVCATLYTVFYEQFLSALSLSKANFDRRIIFGLFRYRKACITIEMVFVVGLDVFFFEWPIIA